MLLLLRQLYLGEMFVRICARHNRVVDDSETICMLNQGITVLTGTETFAKEPKFARLPKIAEAKINARLVP